MEKIIFMDIWYEVKKYYRRNTVDVKLNACGFDKFDGLSPFFDKISPDDLIYDYNLKRFKFSFEIVAIIDDVDGCSFFHKYDFLNSF